MLFFFVLLLVIITTQAYITPARFPSNNALKYNQIGTNSRQGMQLYGGKGKFGIFSPAVYVAKAVIGEGKFIKFRGKIISLHSQAITEWCKTYGAYNLRTKLIKKAKINGDRLGFLV